MRRFVRAAGELFLNFSEHLHRLIELLDTLSRLFELGGHQILQLRFQRNLLVKMLCSNLFNLERSIQTV